VTRSDGKGKVVWLRIALLQIISIQETLGALRLTLLKQNLLDLEILQASEAQFRELWKPVRETIASVGEESGPTPDELLRMFEGPTN
jgi:hypothetical protein